MENYKKRLLKTLEINGVKNNQLTSSISNSICAHCKKELDKDNKYLVARFTHCFGKYSYAIQMTINKKSSNTEYPLAFDEVLVAFMCRTCIDEMFSRKNIVIIPINHNGDFRTDYYLLWSLDKKYSKKKIEEMYSLALKTIVIDYAPYDPLEKIFSNFSNSSYNELKMHPYLLEATFSERGMYREIRELNTWIDILHKRNKKMRDILIALFSTLIIFVLLSII